MSQAPQPKFSASENEPRRIDYGMEKPTLEKDVERISKEIWERREKIPSKDISDREIVRSVIGERIQKAQAKPPQKSSILPKYLEGESEEIKAKVEELVNIAFQKGLDASIGEANKFGPFIVDALHDALTGKVYEELKNRGKLK